MMFVDYRTESPWIVDLDDGCQIQWNFTILDVFELITKNLFSRECTRGQSE